MGLRNKQYYHDKKIFFITSTCHKWLPLFIVGDAMEILSESLNFCANKYHADILGYVLMPNHIHLILHLAEGSKRGDLLRDFKKFTSTKIRQEIEKCQPEQLAALRYQQNGQVFKVWKDKFNELYLESRELLEVKLGYIHKNPLQSHWNLTNRPEDYLYSSALFYATGIQNKVFVRHYRDFI
jgi:putative transposase